MNIEYTNNEKVDMLCCFHRSNNNKREAAVLYQNLYPNRRQPHVNTFKNLEKSLRSTGKFSKRMNNAVQNRRGNNDDDDVVILAYFRANPRISTRQAAVELNVTRYKIQKVLKLHKLKPYKLHLVQTLHPNDPNNRLVFCEWLLNVGRQHLSNIIWTDESNFHRNGIFNKRNTHYWDDENPRVIVEARAQVRFSINVWIGVVGNRILGPHFYDGTLTQDRYLLFLQNEFQDYLDNLPLAARQNLWFQHDGAPAHNGGQVTNFLNNEFAQNWIGNRGPVLWPARSPDLSVLDFFVWGFLKNKVYDTPQNLQELRNKITEACLLITPEMLRNARGNIIKRAQKCLEFNGGQFEQSL